MGSSRRTACLENIKTLAVQSDDPITVRNTRLCGWRPRHHINNASIAGRIDASVRSPVRLGISGMWTLNHAVPAAYCGLCRKR